MISMVKFLTQILPVVNQYYDAEIIKEYVMKGNSAIIKCSIPSFVADFVSVVGWTDEEGKEYLNSNTQKDGIISSLNQPELKYPSPADLEFTKTSDPFIII